MKALGNIRICDFTGQLAGAGSTRFLAAFGAQVIRIEDPVDEGRWDILRNMGPFVDERRGADLSGSFNNHNVEKLGITLNLRSPRGRELLAQLVAISDVVSENFAYGVLARMGFDYAKLRSIREDVVYVSNCGFGHSGPYAGFKTWGPIVQAICGLTFSSGLRDQPPAGWGYSYMDHTGAYYMAIAILMALYHRSRTGEGQWVDMSCTEAGASLNGPPLLDYTVNGRRLRRKGMPDSNRSQHPRMAPHGIYPARGDDEWIAIACRDDADWQRLADTVAEPWARESRFATLDGRIQHEDALDENVASLSVAHDKFALAARLQRAGLPAAPVQQPRERIDEDEHNRAWGLWPTVVHEKIGKVRVDGLPVQLSETNWELSRGAACLGQHNDFVYGELLGLDADEIDSLRAEGVI
jgi:crotonobetainyl-CoA:carnitine CoA-transferase CaiB-like acyl-CoA transferase